jgi:hypothetical protein
MSHIILPRHGDGGHMDNGNLSNTDMGYMPTDEENNAVCLSRNGMVRLTDG